MLEGLEVVTLKDREVVALNIFSLRWPSYSLIKEFIKYGMAYMGSEQSQRAQMHAEWFTDVLRDLCTNDSLHKYTFQCRQEIFLTLYSWKKQCTHKLKQFAHVFLVQTHKFLHFFNSESSVANPVSVSLPDGIFCLSKPLHDSNTFPRPTLCI